MDRRTVHAGQGRVFAWPTADLAPERLAAVSGVVAGRPDFSDPVVVQILALAPLHRVAAPVHFVYAALHVLLNLQGVVRRVVTVLADRGVDVRLQHEAVSHVAYAHSVHAALHEDVLVAHLQVDGSLALRVPVVVHLQGLAGEHLDGAQEGGAPAALVQEAVLHVDGLPPRQVEGGEVLLEPLRHDEAVRVHLDREVVAPQPLDHHDVLPDVDEDVDVAERHGSPRDVRDVLVPLRRRRAPGVEEVMRVAREDAGVVRPLDLHEPLLVRARQVGHDAVEGHVQARSLALRRRLHRVLHRAAPDDLGLRRPARGQGHLLL
mmetsp:Transcript_65244/g.191436  ORF Transcript_65244/g.191436 Transcript_65244/m.191436 type:complete len:319 (-) Transcript_65244:832-1788(-)